MGRMDDSEVQGEGSWHTKWFGSLEVIQPDRRRLPAARSTLQGARKAPLLCINISPLSLVTLCLLYLEQAGSAMTLRATPASEEAKQRLQPEGTGQIRCHATRS